MTSETPEVVVAGHICVDLTPAFPAGLSAATVQELLAPGKLVNVGNMVVATGGAVSNTGLGLVRLGVRTALMGKVGGDLLGRIVLQRLEEHGAADGMVVVPGESSSYTIVIAPPGIDRIFLHNPGANDTFGAADVGYERVQRARLFHLGYPPLLRSLFRNDGEQLTEIFRRVKGMGVTTSLDMALPDPASEAGRADWAGILRRTLPYVDLFLPSVEEMLFMLERERFMELTRRAAGRDLLDALEPDDPRRLGRRLLDCGAKVVALKCGRRGLYAATGAANTLAGFGAAPPADPANWTDRELWEEPFAVARVASATGAGDTAIAGFLCAWLRGQTIEMCARYANAVGAQNVMVYDSVSGIRTWADTQRMVAAGWAKERRPLTGPNWRYDERRGVWVGRSDRTF